MSGDLTFRVPILHIGIPTSNNRIYGKGVVTNGLKEYFKDHVRIYFTTIIDENSPATPLFNNCIATSDKKDLVIENKVLYATMTFLSEKLKNDFIRLYSTSMAEVKPIAFGTVDKRNRVQNFEIAYVFVDCLDGEPLKLDKIEALEALQ